MNENKKNANKSNNRSYSNKGKRNRKPFNKSFDKEAQECNSNTTHHVITSANSDNDPRSYLQV